MKKIIWFIPIVIVCGILAALLRGYELAFGFDFQSGLPVGMSWITPTLLVIGAVFAVVGFLFIKKRKLPAMEPKKSIVFTAVSLLCCAVMLALAGYAVYENQLQGETIVYLFAGLSVLNAISFAVVGLKNLEENDSPIYSTLAFIQVLWATLAVILVFRERVSEPIYEHFAFLLFAYLCILLFTYGQIGYVFGKNRFAVTYIVGILGAYFAIIELVAPFIASGMNAEYYLSPDFKIILPIAAYLIYMPTALFKILRNENNIA